jgi:hypothetical protein
MKLLSKAMAGLLVVGFLTIQSSSEAELYSSPGVMCVSETPADTYVSFGSLYNTLSAMSSSPFTCPMTRRAPDTAQISDINVVVDDQGIVSVNHDGDVCCSVRSCYDNGSACNVSPTVCSAGTGVQTLALAAVGGHTNGYAFIRCNMGVASKGQSGVVSYRWDD